MSERKRKAPFSAFEKALLRELMAGAVDVIESKKTDSEQSRKKVRAWEGISHKYNSNPQCQPATVDQLRKLWLNMKSKARDAKTAVKQRCHTGGGPYIPDLKPEDDAVLEMIPNILPTIKVVQDSDGFGDHDGDEDDDSWVSIKKRKENLEADILLEQNHHTPYTPDTTSTITSATTTTVNSLTPIMSTIIPTTSISVGPTITISPTPTSTSAPQNSIRKKNTQHTTSRHQKFNIDELKCRLIANDIAQRETKYQVELAHQKRMSELEYKILLLEYEHKKRYYNLLESEVQLNMEKEQNQNK